MEYVEAILSVDDVEIATIGPFDLAVHMGGVGEPGVAENINNFCAALESVCRDNDIHILKPVGNPPRLKDAIPRGCQCIIASVDISYLLDHNKRWVKTMSINHSRWISLTTSLDLPPDLLIFVPLTILQKLRRIA
jgi:2-keto-3-deoxy-L-rhamnonate aldolase RhmA